MRWILIILSFLLFQVCIGQENKNSLLEYTNFLKTQETSGIDYILSLWKKNDIVIICERNHGEMTQYNLFLDLIKTDYFIENVGNVFTEIGSTSRQENVQKFIQTTFPDKNTKEKSLIELYRNIKWPIWEKFNFYYFLDSLNSINSSLSDSLKINLFVSDEKDPESGTIKTSDDLKEFIQNESSNRDSVMAFNIIQVFDSIIESKSSRRKCLIIMNYRHAFSKPIDNRTNDYLNITNVGTLLFDHYNGICTNVYLNSLALTVTPIDTNKNKIFRDYISTPIQNGKWDASFELLGIESSGFDFKMTPYGKDSLDIWPWSNQYTYQDIFTGFIYYQPLRKHYEIFGIPNILNDGFANELLQRLNIFIEVYGGSKIEKDDLPKYFNYTENQYDRLPEFIEIINNAKNEINKR